MKSAELVLPCGRREPREERPRKTSPLKEKLTRYLQSRDLKKSEARDKILEVIFSNPRHFSIQDLIVQVHKKFAHIGPATIYRNVNLLVDAQVLRETLTTESGDTLYELDVSEHHDHIVCVDCHRVFEFHEDVIEEAQNKLGRKLKFDPVNHRHIIFAKCSYKKN